MKTNALGLIAAALIFALASSTPARANVMDKPVRRPIGPNLLYDGSFDSAPAPTANEGHGHVLDSTELAGWIVRGKVYSLGIGRDRRLCLGESGSIEQSVATRPGQSYLLIFDLSSAGAGPRIKTVNVRAGRVPASFTYDGQQGEPDMIGVWVIRRVEFKATGKRTRIRLTNPSTDYHGPHIGDVALIAVTPALLAKEAIANRYASIRTAIMNGNASQAADVLTPDFQARAADGSVLPRDAYLQGLGKIQDAVGLAVTYDVGTLAPGPGGDNTLVARVQRRFTYSEINKYGARKDGEILSTLVDTWTRVGNSWKLKSSEEKSRVVKIDGVEQKAP